MPRPSEAYGVGSRPSRGFRSLRRTTGRALEDRTQIVDSGRNLPERFAGKVGRPPATGPVAERIKFIRDRVGQGIDPLYVGELVREGVENDWPCIFTDNELEPFIEARFAAIKEGFNQIRGRIPGRCARRPATDANVRDVRFWHF